MSSGEVALMLVYAVQLTGFFSWIMRQSAELQNGVRTFVAPSYFQKISQFVVLNVYTFGDGILCFLSAYWHQGLLNQLTSRWFLLSVSYNTRSWSRNMMITAY